MPELFKNSVIRWQTVRRLFFSSIIITLILPVLTGSYRVFRADRILMNGKGLHDYDRAIHLDPSNANHWWNRGRLYHYSVDAIDLARATQEYRKALALNPRLGHAWADLAQCYEQRGMIEQAEQSLQQALRTRTYSPLTRWQAGNFYLRRGNLEAMYQNFRVVCDRDPDKLGIVVRVAWKAESDRSRILKRLVPDSLEANLLYLDFLLGEESFELARQVWQRSLANEVPRGFRYGLTQSFPYVQRLLDRGDAAGAVQVWEETARKAGMDIDNQTRRDGPLNLVWNSSFEREVVHGGFDWRFPADPADVRFQLDVSRQTEGARSLRITFKGTNIRFSHLQKTVPVLEQGRYQLQYSLRTQDLGSDEQPYFQIECFPRSSGARLSRKQFPRSSEWTRHTEEFSVEEGCQTVRLILCRDPSTQFTNELRGSLWLDQVTIHKVDSQTDSMTKTKYRSHITYNAP